MSSPKCTSCDDGRETLGIFEGLAIGIFFTFCACVLSFVNMPAAHSTCLKSCEASGHTVSSFDVQRGCICSDPFPTKRKWVSP